MPLTALLSSNPGSICRCYKHLDKCEYQITPCQVKYQLHNMDTQTLFHCNCTHMSRRKRQGFSHHHRALCADRLGSDEVGPLPLLCLQAGTVPVQGK